METLPVFEKRKEIKLLLTLPDQIVCQLGEDLFGTVAHSLLQHGRDLLLAHEDGFRLFAAILAEIQHHV